jgi:hypothetical protein
LIHQNQSLFGDVYKTKRELLYYVKHYKDFIGTPLSIFILLGFLSAMISIRRYFLSSPTHRLFVENLFLIYGAFFACFILHTLLFWLPNVFINLGMIRYMITIIPTGLLIALHELNLIFSIPMLKSYWTHAFICELFVFFIIYNAVDRWYFSFRMGEEEKLIKEVVD